MHFKGRFDLKSTIFTCEFCGTDLEAVTTDYISSGFWPGNPSNVTYLFSEDLLRFWFLTKHNTPGTSLNKFLETLENLSDEYKPVFEKLLSKSGHISLHFSSLVKANKQDPIS